MQNVEVGPSRRGNARSVTYLTFKKRSGRDISIWNRLYIEEIALFRCWKWFNTHHWSGRPQWFQEHQSPIVVSFLSWGSQREYGQQEKDEHSLKTVGDQQNVGEGWKTSNPQRAMIVVQRAPWQQHQVAQQRTIYAKDSGIHPFISYTPHLRHRLSWELLRK